MPITDDEHLFYCKKFNKVLDYYDTQQFILFTEECHESLNLFTCNDNCFKWFYSRDTCEIAGQDHCLYCEIYDYCLNPNKSR